MALDLFPALEGQAVLQSNIGAPIISAGENAEVHKEHVDKNTLRKLIIGLSGDREGERVQFREEVQTCSYGLQNNMVSPSPAKGLARQTRCLLPEAFP